MKRLKAVVKPHVLNTAVSALHELGIEDVIAEDVRGHGRQRGHTELFRGGEYEVNLLPKVMISASIADDMVASAIQKLRGAICTGRIGDGVVWCVPASGKRATCEIFEANIIVRPHRLDDTLEVMRAHGVQGTTVQEVAGIGGARGRTELHPGPDFAKDLVPKVRILAVSTWDGLNEMLGAIIKVNQSGNAGDGKIWILGVTDWCRIRTNERILDL